MNEPAQSIGRGRHGPRPQPDRRLTVAEVAYAEGRFAENAMPMAVCAEMKLRWPEHEFKYRTIWGLRERWLERRSESSSDRDDGDAAA